MVISRRNAPLVAAVASLMVVSTEAWTTLQRRATRVRVSSSNPASSMIRQDTAHYADGRTMVRGRRKFLWQSATMLLPVVVHAEDETSQVSVSSPTPLPVDEKIVTEEKELVDDASETVPPPVDEKIVIEEKESVEEVSETKSVPRVDEKIVMEEKELVDEIIKEEREEAKAMEDTKKLITGLEEQIKDEASDAKPDVALQKMQNNKDLIDKLEKEEEEIESETKEIIEKIEILEKETGEVPPPQEQEIIDKLKDRVEKKEDLITRLKQKSEKDIDPKTGKFRTMTSKDFKARAPSDFDFLGYLKDTMTNTEEFERDLDAFKGLLDSKFGPVIDAGRKAEKKLGPVIEEARKAAEPAIEEARKAATPAIEEGRKAAGSAAESILQDIKNRL